jgi:hypothetical protein
MKNITANLGVQIFFQERMSGGMAKLNMYRQGQTSKYRLKNKHKKTRALNPKERHLCFGATSP